MPILLQKSPTRGERSAASGFKDDREPCLATCSVGSSGLVEPAVQLRPGRRLPSIHGGSWRRLRGELGQPAQVLGDRCQGELVLCTAGSAQP